MGFPSKIELDSTPTPVRVVGRYALYDEIASGGMATVHVGRLIGPVGFARTVAIKRLHPQFAKDPEFVTMFLDEARLAARIRHPNVVQTLDVVATDGELFLVMDYVQGESLSRLARSLRTNGTRVPPRVAVACLSSVLHGLHAAHEAKNERGEALGIVHRDVSPQNILIGADGVARVLDFGVAKAAGRLQTTREGQIKGKLAYMAPEQLRGGIVDRRTDIYAAAVVLWETLTGQRLFEGENEGMVLARVLEGEVPKPSSIAPGISPALDEVVLRGLARDRLTRFATAREMARELERAVPQASSSEVGEWVEAVAGELIVRRAEQIAGIESSSIVSNVLARDGITQMGMASGGGAKSRADSALEEIASSGNTGNHPLESGRRIIGSGGDGPNSQLSSISVVSAKNDASESRGRWSAIGISLAVFAFFGIGAFAKLRLHSDATEGVAADVHVASLVTNETSHTVPPVSPPPPPPEVAASATPVRPPPAPRVPSRTAPAATGRATNGKTSCDPPYTLDAEGHKHYKISCL